MCVCVCVMGGVLPAPDWDERQCVSFRAQGYGLWVIKFLQMGLEESP